jgi:hypothetical protein
MCEHPQTVNLVDASGAPLFTVVVCNGGDGRELHPASPRASPKIKYKTAVLFKVCAAGVSFHL